MKQFRLVSIMLCIVVVLMVSGCGTLSKKKETAIGLNTARSVLVIAGKTTKALCANNVLSENECVIAESAYRDGRSALIEAKAVWDEMVVIDSFDNNTRYNELIMRVVRLTATIETIINKYKENK